MTTIYEVAKNAGVSVATVSRVLNNTGYVKDTTRFKVEESIEKLNYTPNVTARNLYKQKTDIIGLLIPDISNPFFTELYKQIELYADEAGFNILLFNSNYSTKREEKFLEVVQSKIMDGAIIVSDTLDAEALENLGIPIITLDRKISESISSVTVDNYKGARQVVSYLVEAGCQTIAHITGPRNNFTAKERLKGYKAEMGQRGQKVIFVEGDYHINRAVSATNELLLGHPHIDGIFASNDMVALGVVKALAIKKIDFKTIKIIGFDGIKLGTGISPEISTLVQPIEEIAKSAVDHLVNSSTEVRHLVFEAKLLKRET